MEFGCRLTWTKFTFGIEYYHPLRHFSVDIGPLELYVKRKPDFTFSLECEIFDGSEESENDYKKAYGK